MVDIAKSLEQFHGAGTLSRAKFPISQNTREYYLLQNRIPGKIDFIVRNLSDIQSVAPGPLVVDVGCTNGEILQQVATRLSGKDFRFVGVDIDEGYIQEAQERFTHNNASLSFLRADALHMPFGKNSVAAFHCGNLLHELYSHAKLEPSSKLFTNAPVIAALRNMRKQLMDGGKIIIREAAKPENPDEQIEMQFTHMQLFKEGSTHEGQETVFAGKRNDLDGLAGELASIPTTELSNYALFLRFCHEYIHLRDKGKEETLVRSVGVLEEGRFTVPAWLVAEFAKKRRVAQKDSDMWKLEMDEQNGVYTRDELTHLARKAGFTKKDIHLETVMEQGYNSVITDDLGIILRDKKGEKIDFRRRFDSHIYGFIEKRKRGMGFWRLFHR